MILDWQVINMLGADTLLFTKKGFKKLIELDIYDEVLTPYGVFEPIVKLGPWKPMDKVIKLNTLEDICCTDNLMLNAADHCNGSYTYVDEVDDKNYYFDPIMEFEGDGKNHPVSNGYDFAVVVPTCIPDAYILSPIEERLKLFAGLVDSPICELGKVDGIYNFYTYYDDLMQGIVTLCRSLGFGVTCSKKKMVYKIGVSVNKYIDIIPIKDELKMCHNYATMSKRAYVSKVAENKNFTLGREVKVNGGFFLVGYSMVPVA